MFGSLLTAMVTPFDENLEVDYLRAVELARYLLEQGSDGLVLSGTTGETPVLSRDEKLKLYSILVQEIGSEHVIAGTGGNNTEEVINLTREAEKIGVGGIMLVSPYYNKPPQEGLYAHFRAIAESISLPVILYNVPGRTGVNIEVETVLQLAEIDNIVALKDASGSTEQASYILEKAPADFQIYSGDDSLTLPFLSIGGYGVISVASHIVGAQIKELIDLFNNNDNLGAARLYRYLMPLVKSLFVTTNPIPVKEALNLLGFDVGKPRLPLVPMTEEQRECLSKLLDKYNITVSMKKVAVDTQY